jgi:hypothetical protein
MIWATVGRPTTEIYNADAYFAECLFLSDSIIDSMFLQQPLRTVMNKVKESALDYPLLR